MLYSKNWLIGLLILCNGLAVASELDQLAIRYGTDKSSQWHDYAKRYEKYFAPYKDRSIKFLEIGLAMGYSAHMWEHYFSKAQLHFIESDKKFLDIYQSLDSSRSHCYLLDQANENDLLHFINHVGGEFDIILDDGGHQMDQQIISFRMLFPTLKSGGMYIIEDLATSFTATGSYKPESMPGSTVFFLKQLIDEINAFTIKPAGLPYFCADYKRYNDLSYYQKHIESIHFYNCMVVIIKR
jgi:hypothetical protein